MGGDQPKAVLLRIKLTLLLLENDEKFGTDREQLKKDFETYTQGRGHRGSELEGGNPTEASGSFKNSILYAKYLRNSRVLNEDYAKYLTNINNYPLSQLSVEEEKYILSNVPRTLASIECHRDFLDNSPTARVIPTYSLGKIKRQTDAFKALDLQELARDMPGTSSELPVEVAMYKNWHSSSIKDKACMYRVAREGTKEQKFILQQHLLLSIFQRDWLSDEQWDILMLSVLENSQEFPTCQEIESLKPGNEMNHWIRSMITDTDQDTKSTEMANKFNQAISRSATLGKLQKGIAREQIHMPNIPYKQEQEPQGPFQPIPISPYLEVLDDTWTSFIKGLVLSKENLIALMRQANALLNEKQRGLVSLANHIRPEPNSRELMSHWVSPHLKLSLDDLIVLFKQGDLNAYLFKTNLSETQIFDLDRQLGELMVYSTRLAQLKRLLDLYNEKEISPDKELLDKKIASEISAVRPYKMASDKDSRTYLVFEYNQGILLRTKQKEKITESVNHSHQEPLSLELGTGTGKTSVISPLMQDLRRNVNEKSSEPPLILNLWPEALYSVNKRDMQANVVKSFKQRADSLDFTRKTSIEASHLRFILDQLKLAQKEKRQVNMTPESLQSLELKFYEALNDPSTTYAQISFMQKILRMIEKGEGHIDESHINLSPKRELNFTIGNPEYESLDIILILGQMFSFLIQGTVGDILKLKEDKQRFVPKEQFDEEIAPALAAHMADVLNIADKEAFKEYVRGEGHLKAWVIQHPKRDLIALVRGHLNAQNPLLYEMFQGSVNVNYGLSHQDKNSQHAKPYLGNDTPNEKADYELIYEALDKTYLTHICQGINSEQQWQLVQTLQKQAIQQSKQTFPRLDLQETEAYKFFKKHFPDLGNLFSVHKLSLQPYHKELEKNPELIIRFVTYLVAPTLRKYSKKFKSTSQNMRSLLSNFIAMSATPAHPASYAPHAVCSLDAESRQKVGSALKAKCAAKDSIHISKSSQPREILRELMPLLKDSFRMLIDSGALFKGIGNEELARMLLQKFKEINPHIKGVAFFDAKNRFMILEDKKGHPIPLEQSTLPIHERFTYCDQRHAFGTDTKQFSKAKALATFDTSTTTDEVLQAVGRLRQFLEGQSVEWALTSDAQKIIPKKEDDRLTIEDLLDHADENQNKLNKDILYASLRHQMHNEIRCTLKKLLVHAYDPRSLYQKFKDFLLEINENTPFVLFGQDNKTLHAADALHEYRQRLIKLIEGLFYIPSVEQQALKKRLNSYESRIEAVRSELSSNISLQALNLGVAAETQIDVEAQQQKESQTDTQSQAQDQTQTTNALQNIAWGKKIQPYYWQQPFSFYVNDWLTPWVFYSNGQAYSTEASKQVPVFSFDEVFNQFPKIVKPQHLLSSIQGSILFTDNFMRFSSDIKTEPLSENQKGLYEVLLILDEDEKGQKKWTLIMGDQSTDAAIWRKQLEIMAHKSVMKHKRRICLYDLTAGIVQDSPNQIQESEFIKDEDLQKMLTVVKLFNGDVFYSEKQADILKKLGPQGLKEVMGFSTQARTWHNVKQSQFPISTLATIFGNL